MSECEPQHKLNQTWRVALRRDPPEISRVRSVRSGRAKDHPVEGVYELAAELNLLATLAQSEVPEE